MLAAITPRVLEATMMYMVDASVSKHAKLILAQYPQAAGSNESNPS
jgi:hypothetical protein